MALLTRVARDIVPATHEPLSKSLRADSADFAPLAAEFFKKQACGVVSRTTNENPPP
jgi:hypothetical protein